jgi:peptidoglycan/xylan/chitin deacetylase (PgdA/CDA1 family)
VAEGHELGNHTNTHPSLPGLSASAVRFELSATERAVNEALGYTYPLVQVRPPYGANTQRVRDVIEDASRCMVLWDVDSNDWKYSANDEKIFANLFAVDYSVYRKGGVVLMHDVHPQTARVLDGVLDRLEAEGFTFTTTGQMLEQKYPVPEPVAPSVR